MMIPNNRDRGPPHSSNLPAPTKETHASNTSTTHVYVNYGTLRQMIEPFEPPENHEFLAALIPLPEDSSDLDEQDPFAVEDLNHEHQWMEQEVLNKGKSKSPQVEASNLNQKYLLSELQDFDESNPQAAEAQRKSLIEWFDHSVKKELQKRRNPGNLTASCVDPAMALLKVKHNLNLSKGTTKQIAKTSTAEAKRIQTELSKVQETIPEDCGDNKNLDDLKKSH